MTHPGSGLNIVSREQWKARQPKDELSVMTEPAAYVFIHHGDSPEAKDLETGCMMARVYQNTHMDDNKYSATFASRWNIRYDMDFAFVCVVLGCLSSLAAGADTPCLNTGGTCQDISISCAGQYHVGLCSGDANRRCCVPSAHSAASCPHIISRAEWGARAPTAHIGNMPGPAQYVFIHHGDSAPCSTEAACKAKVKSYQDYHLDGHHWSDIGYNFVVGEDGNAYMARGWTEIGAHTQNYNSVGIAICVIGTFNDHVPNDAALNKIKALIQCGLDSGHILPSYTLKGHRDVGSTDCPGTALYNLIHSWPHYVAGTAHYSG